MTYKSEMKTSADRQKNIEIKWEETNKIRSTMNRTSVTET
jgi:hypothetical protein